MMKKNWMMTVLLVVICFIALIQCDSHKLIPLNISFITSINPEAGFSAAGGIPAIEMALEMINNRTDILANYTIQHTEILDSRVSEKINVHAAVTPIRCCALTV